MYDLATILITGGTGSWGQTLTKRLIKSDVKEIRIFSRNELAQVNMRREVNDPRIKYIIGDIRDKEAVMEAMKGVDYVFHLAALKHVPICENQPMEAILTNVNGTENIIKAAINNDVKKVIDVSTDKAVSPHNLYGMTKAIGEKLITNANLLSDKTKFVCIRAGNVMGSNGSVIPYFINQIKTSNEVTLTDINMTRYFMTLDEAIDLLIKASKESYGGEILVMNMPACKIVDLAKVLIDEYGNKETRIREIGIRPGEKIHEELVSKFESINTYKLSKNYYLILPDNNEMLKVYYSHIDINDKVGFEVFNSNQLLMNKDEIRNKLVEGKFI